MSADSCCAVFDAAPVNERASHLDKAHPKCACEPWALTAEGGAGILAGEKLARILTSPDDYNETTDTIITGRLTAIYSMGMSVVREGATDKEIADTIGDLLKGGAEQRRLFGAVVISAAEIREFANDDDQLRWFGVYATDDRGKTHHGDVFGTTASKSQQSKRRGKLALKMVPLIVSDDTTEGLIAKLREAGI